MYALFWNRLQSLSLNNYYESLVSVRVGKKLSLPFRENVSDGLSDDYLPWYTTRCSMCACLYIFIIVPKLKTLSGKTGKSSVKIRLILSLDRAGDEAVLDPLAEKGINNHGRQGRNGQRGADRLYCP